jgi:uncharacterized glyoxalase superfamily protein PhnB
MNRSVPVDAVMPHVVYRDVVNAIEWLNRVFGFTEHFRYGEPSGAQLRAGRAWIMVAKAREGRGTPAELGGSTQFLTIFVDDVEGHCQRAKLGGAKILEEPHETVYGEFQYAAEDLDGHCWVFSRHARDLSPEEWGAVVSNSGQMLG